MSTSEVLSMGVAGGLLGVVMLVLLVLAITWLAWITTMASKVNNNWYQVEIMWDDFSNKTKGKR